MNQKVLIRNIEECSFIAKWILKRVSEVYLTNCANSLVLLAISAMFQSPFLLQIYKYVVTKSYKTLTSSLLIFFMIRPKKIYTIKCRNYPLTLIRLVFLRVILSGGINLASPFTFREEFT